MEPIQYVITWVAVSAWVYFRLWIEREYGTPGGIIPPDERIGF